MEVTGKDGASSSAVESNPGDPAAPASPTKAKASSSASTQIGDEAEASTSSKENLSSHPVSDVACTASISFGVGYASLLTCEMVAVLLLGAK